MSLEQGALESLHGPGAEDVLVEDRVRQRPGDRHQGGGVAVNVLVSMHSPSAAPHSIRRSVVTAPDRWLCRSAPFGISSRNPRRASPWARSEFKRDSTRVSRASPVPRASASPGLVNPVMTVTASTRLRIAHLGVARPRSKRSPMKPPLCWSHAVCRRELGDPGAPRGPDCAGGVTGADGRSNQPSVWVR